MLAELLDGEGELIVRKAIEQAKTGDPVAMRLLVPRLLPRLERRLQFDLQRVENAGAVAGAVADVIALASSGELTIDEARAFLGLLEQQRRAIETAELADRLAALEEEQQKRGARRWD